MFKKNKLMAILLIVTMALALAAGCAKTEEQPLAQKQTTETPKAPTAKEVILATTTSTVDSGLLDVLQPEFEKQTGYKLNIISVGSGAAIAMAEKGEADALLVHSPKDEEKIAASKVVVDRQLVMHNDFVLIGPAADPAKIKGLKIEDAFKTIANSKALFVSRGDKSGTHKKELSIWEKTAIKPAGTWYQETGTGMGQTINVAAEKNGYTLADRATYLAQKDKIKNMVIIAEGDKALLNIYHVMQVNPEKFNKVNVEGSKAFVDFMVSAATQEKIKSFGVDKYGQSLFVPDAGKAEGDIAK